MFKNLFTKSTDISFIAPMAGRIIPITKIPDPAFSSGVVGDGFGILPNSGRVVSPVDGEVIMTFETKHAIGIRAANGLEILIHIGLDTVKLKGEGFELLAHQDQKVRKGQDIIFVNMERIKGKIPSLISPVIITNLKGKKVKLLKLGEVSIGEPNIFTIVSI